MALDFPWEAFFQAQNLKERQRQNRLQEVNQAIQSAGGIAEGLESYRHKKLINDLVRQISPQQTPYAGAGVGDTAGVGGTFTAPQRQPPQLFNVFSPEVFGRLVQAYPDQWSEIIKNLTQAQRYSALASGGGGKPPAGYLDKEGNLFLTPGPGLEPVTAQQLPYMAISKSKKFGAETAQAKNTLQDWRNIGKELNPYIPIGFGAASSVFSRAARANQSAARAVKLLRKPSLTWQEFNAYINSDVASIQRGGTPTDIQLHEANYSTLSGQLGRLKTWATGQPAIGLIPSETRAQMLENIRDIVQVDNDIIDDQIDMTREKYADRIIEDPDRFNRLAEKARKIKTLAGEFGDIETTRPSSDRFSAGGNNLSSGAAGLSNMSDDELRRIAAGGQ